MPPVLFVPSHNGVDNKQDIGVDNKQDIGADNYDGGGDDDWRSRLIADIWSYFTIWVR